MQKKGESRPPTGAPPTLVAKSNDLPMSNQVSGTVMTTTGATTTIAAEVGDSAETMTPVNRGTKEAEMEGRRRQVESVRGAIEKRNGSGPTAVSGTKMPPVDGEREVLIESELVKDTEEITAREEEIKVLAQNIKELNDEIADIMQRVEEKKSRETTTVEAPEKTTEQSETSREPYTEQSVSISKSVSSSISSSSSSSSSSAAFSSSLAEERSFNVNEAGSVARGDEAYYPTDRSSSQPTSGVRSKTRGRTAGGAKKEMEIRRSYREHREPIRIKPKDKKKQKRKVEPFEYPVRTTYPHIPETSRGMFKTGTSASSTSSSVSTSSPFSSSSSSSSTSSSTFPYSTYPVPTYSSSSSFPPSTYPSSSTFSMAPPEVTTVIYAIPYVTESPNILSNDMENEEKSLQNQRKPKRPTGLNDIHMVPFVRL